MGLSGLGDLVLTATGDLSRNRRVGQLLARGLPLARILEKFGSAKLVKLQFDNEAPEGLERFGEVTRREGPAADPWPAESRSPAGCPSGWPLRSWHHMG